MVQEHVCDESWLRTFEVSVGGLLLVMPGNFLSAAAGGGWGGGVYGEG